MGDQPDQGVGLVDGNQSGFVDDEHRGRESIEPALRAAVGRDRGSVSTDRVEAAEATGSSQRQPLAYNSLGNDDPSAPTSPGGDLGGL